MIYTDSRYAKGKIFVANDARTGEYPVTVFRRFPYTYTTFVHYVWVERDRIDLIANIFLGDPGKWWVIMDYNPEIIDPFDIPIGTVLRIPNA